ncbi:MAG TPA: sigma-70 family RNA polymerase sigma factor [Terriglobales bacterium]|nr:sigma-70 family RNA polymerase sigma factor [Terriglobales bacterium]
MQDPLPQSVTALLRQWKSGDKEALDALVPALYRELHALAHHYLRGERSGHTLQTTALVNEAYLKMAQQGPVSIQDRAHFVAVAARLMRQILVDAARRRRAGKRDFECKVELNEDLVPSPVRGPDVLALDDALNALSRLDARQSLIVELRFFGGLSVEEIAAVMAISPATTKREWSLARAWLYREIKKGSDGKIGAVAPG